MGRRKRLADEDSDPYAYESRAERKKREKEEDEEIDNKTGHPLYTRCRGTTIGMVGMILFMAAFFLPIYSSHYVFELDIESEDPDVQEAGRQVVANIPFESEGDLVSFNGVFGVRGPKPNAEAMENLTSGLRDTLNSSGSDLEEEDLLGEDPTIVEIYEAQAIANLPAMPVIGKPSRDDVNTIGVFFPSLIFLIFLRRTVREHVSTQRKWINIMVVAPFLLVIFLASAQTSFVGIFIIIFLFSTLTKLMTLDLLKPKKRRRRITFGGIRNLMFIGLIIAFFYIAFPLVLSGLNDMSQENTGNTMFTPTEIEEMKTTYLQGGFDKDLNWSASELFEDGLDAAIVEAGYDADDIPDEAKAELYRQLEAEGILDTDIRLRIAADWGMEPGGYLMLVAGVMRVYGGRKVDISAQKRKSRRQKKKEEEENFGDTTIKTFQSAKKDFSDDEIIMSAGPRDPNAILTQKRSSDTLETDWGDEEEAAGQSPTVESSDRQAAAPAVKRPGMKKMIAPGPKVAVAPATTPGGPQKVMKMSSGSTVRPASIPSAASPDPIPAAMAPIPAAKAPIPAAKEPISAAKAPIPAAKAPISAAKAPIPAAKEPISAAKAPIPAARAPVTAATAPMAGGVTLCPSCGGKTRIIEEYDRHWCDACQEYI